MLGGFLKRTMALEDTKELDLERIQRDFNITQSRMNELAPKKTDLKEIYHDFQINMPKLEKARAEILSILNDKLNGKAHSIRARIKDKDHLIEKVIRNVCDKPKKYEKICLSNYNKIVTDLIGVRIIILDKKDWREIHNSLLEIFRNLPDRYAVGSGDLETNYDKYKNDSASEKDALAESYHAEKPVVYITSEDDRKLYADENLKIDNSKTHYRSIHYIIRYDFVYFEIQVRTLFEEGWLEFDHRIKYPCDQNNKKKQEYINVLSSLAVAADRLISFYNNMDFQQKSEDDPEDAAQENVIDEAEIKDQNLEGKMVQYF